MIATSTAVSRNISSSQSNIMRLRLFSGLAADR